MCVISGGNVEEKAYFPFVLNSFFFSFFDDAFQGDSNVSFSNWFSGSQVINFFRIQRRNFEFFFFLKIRGIFKKLNKSEASRQNQRLGVFFIFYRFKKKWNYCINFLSNLGILKEVTKTWFSYHFCFLQMSNLSWNWNEKLLLLNRPLMDQLIINGGKGHGQCVFE